MLNNVLREICTISDSDQLMQRDRDAGPGHGMRTDLGRAVSEASRSFKCLYELKYSRDAVWLARILKAASWL